MLSFILRSRSSALRVLTQPQLARVGSVSVPLLIDDMHGGRSFIALRCREVDADYFAGVRLAFDAIQSQ